MTDDEERLRAELEALQKEQLLAYAKIFKNIFSEKFATKGIVKDVIASLQCEHAKSPAEGIVVVVDFNPMHAQTANAMALLKRILESRGVAHEVRGKEMRFSGNQLTATLSDNREPLQSDDAHWLRLVGQNNVPAGRGPGKR